MITPQLIPSEVYEFLIEEYRGDWYKNELCETCSIEVEKLKNLIRLLKRAIEISSIRLGDKELNSIRQAVDLIRKINAESLGSGIE